VLLSSWYNRIWYRRLRAVWPNSRDRARYSRWHDLPARANPTHRDARAGYLESTHPKETYEAQAEWVLLELERDIAERALTTGLAVGISRNRYFDMLTIFAAALELQLHVLSRLGKRPSWHAWKLLIQRCGASLFL